MDLPLNFPHGSRFWQLFLDALADLSTGEFMLLDGSIVAGNRAERLCRRIEREGVEISEESFREMARSSWLQRCEAIKERAQRDPRYAKALKAAFAAEGGVIEQWCTHLGWDALRNALDPEDQIEGAKLLLKIVATKQNLAWQ